MNNMEEDTKDLKELRKELGLCADGSKIKQGIALEHLIKAYKELEEKLNETLNVNLALVQGNANSIPVSLVEEKIEELNKEEKELQDSITEEEREEYSDANISYGLMLIENQRKVL
ncbi:MAG: hypothetical protein ACI4VH_02895 [Clostridia bacterium]